MASDDAVRKDHKGLLLDWGGVMTTNLFAAFGAFCATEGVAPDLLREAFRHDEETRDALIAFEEGRMNDDLFASHLARALGLPHERAEGLLDRMMAGASVESDMVDMVRRARAAGIRVAMVSNSWGELRYPQEVVAELFDATVISGKEGFRKPDTRMYTLGAERLGLQPADCVMVDDLPFNLKPAAELGMATVLHHDPEATIGRLQVLLGVPLR
ncbi:HAD family hydrolase [Conexibacter woesei]|uniref:HAD family hydrolase n=1 Tax=Conexibacter woesei TaxID=191495 RepID=UPI00040C66E9|nr:HAD family phosphatase [Conexibacter woesei]